MENWKLEIQKVAAKYHFTGSLVAVFFNVIFFFTDVINIPEHWQFFLQLRLFDSFLIAVNLLLYKKFKYKSEYMVFISAIIIVKQNAIMWCFMDEHQMLKHTLAYIALFIGAALLLLWELKYSIIFVLASLLSNIIFLGLLSDHDLETILQNGGLLTGFVAVLSIILVQTRYNLNKREIISRLALVEANMAIAQQKKIVEEKSESILDSIRYAKRIQDAVLPTLDYMKSHLPNSFVFYRPKDIVSGDFYWYEYLLGKSFIAAVDCTGHGIPGAFMSMIGHTLLNKFNDRPGISPAEMLNDMRDQVITALQQESNNTKDGMELQMCIIDHEQGILQYSGAQNPLYYIRNNELIEIKADKMPVGISVMSHMKPFTNHVIPIEPGDCFYLFSDGYPDQFGGPNDKKFTYKRLRELFLSIHKLDFDKQNEIVAKTFDDWKSDGEQIDDVLVIGFRI